jgi:hypothetical protein
MRRRNRPGLIKSGAVVLILISFLAHAHKGHAAGLYHAADNETCTAASTLSLLSAHHSDVFRYIVPANPAETYQGVACVAAARAAGYRIYLSIQYDPSESTAGIVALFGSVMDAYGPAWAIAVGNEETEVPYSYAAQWDAVEPEIAAQDPRAIRVGGETFPWSVNWARQVLSSGLVGLQAWADHCYDTRVGGLSSVPVVARLARRAGVPLYCSEMAPATSSTSPSFFATTNQQTYDHLLRSVIRRSPNLKLISYYVWPSIGAN